MARGKAAESELLQSYSPGRPEFLWKSLLRFSPPVTSSALGFLCHRRLGQQEAVGTHARDLNGISALLTRRAPARGFYTASLGRNVVAKHGRARRRKKKC